MGGRITVQLVSSFARLDQTKKGKFCFFICNEAVESKLVKLETKPYSDPSPNSECFLAFLTLVHYQNQTLTNDLQTNRA